MSQEIAEFMQNLDAVADAGKIDPVEAWWVERQEALERAGYMLRPRYRPGWKPSWAGTNKDYSRSEDGQFQWVRMNHFALSWSFIFMSLAACLYGCNSDFRRETCDVEKGPLTRRAL